MAKADTWLTEKIAAQCLIPKLEPERYQEEPIYKEKIRKLTEQGVGGFCIFGGTPNQVEQVTQELQSLSETPLIFSADFEYGLPMRLSEGTAFPHAMALGKTGDPKITYDVAKSIAIEAKNLGIHWNLAPVCDINSNRDNPIINIRSFGENRQTVINHSVAFIKGTKEAGCISCAKHFPGHGNTSVDSHLELAYLDSEFSELFEFEIAPFKAAIEAKVPTIMVGHLAVKAFDDSYLPASISRKIIIGILREQLDFKGLILTDALEMKAISSKYSSAEASVLSLKAGNNIALMPIDSFEALQAIIDKANEEPDFRFHLQNSANLLLSIKRQCGLIPQFAKPDTSPQVFIQHSKTALRYAYQAINTYGDKSIIPLKPNIQIAGFGFLQTSKDLQSATRFFTMLAQAIENDIDFGYLDDSIDEKQLESIKVSIDRAELVIFGLFHKSVAYHGNAGINQNIIQAVKELSKSKRSIMIFFGNPYLDDKVKSDFNIFTYSDSFASLAAAIVKLTGREQALTY